MRNDRATAVTYKAGLGLGGVPADRASGGGRANAQDIPKLAGAVENVHS